ncbi:hypothetical protein AMTR_s00067p00094200 [Amborella trichopoda]|uniref:t-SNARE coiled-coil homology domain-containing protein n=1 Tax=Amborella trichopoda TaxID=13333 RepID=U5DBJ5_AMBTC|nr:hypothetical protein AMTR_s00067p00094200 [Amborella trichopoda]
MDIPQRRGFSGGGAIRSREGASTRVGSSSQEEIQLRIDPLHADLDEEITGLHRKIIQLKSVAQEIETEAKFQNDFISQLMHLLDCWRSFKGRLWKVSLKYHVFVHSDWLLALAKGCAWQAEENCNLKILGAEEKCNLKILGIFSACNNNYGQHVILNMNVPREKRLMESAELNLKPHR